MTPEERFNKIKILIKILAAHETLEGLEVNVKKVELDKEFHFLLRSAKVFVGKLKDNVEENILTELVSGNKNIEDVVGREEEGNL